MYMLAWLIMPCLVAGTFGGWYAAYLTTAWLAASPWFQPPRRRLYSREVACAAGTVAIPFAWFLSIVGGGNLGGSYASAFGERVGIVPPEALVPIGIGLGVVLFDWPAVAAASCTAFALVRTLNRIGPQPQGGPIRRDSSCFARYPPAHRRAAR